MAYWGLRSSKESRSIHRTSFKWNEIEDGYIVGTPCVKLKGDHNNQNGRGAALTNRTAKLYLAYVDHLPIIQYKGLFYLYTMLKHHINCLMPPPHLLIQDVGYIFRKEASQAQLAVSFTVVTNFSVVILFSYFFVLFNNVGR